MKKRLLTLPFLLIILCSCFGQSNENLKICWAKKEQVLKIMDKVADWQLNNPSGKELWEWEYGTFYAGLISHYKLHPQKKYLDAMIQMGEDLDWKLKPNPYIADNYAIAQTYIDLFEIVKDSIMIDKTRYMMDMEFYKHPSKPDLRWVDNPYKLYCWSWCDALFMAPPAFVKMSKITGDKNYIDEMDRLWRLTYNYLFDQDEHLYFRDDSYFKLRTINNKKVFWSRGNGWVMGGLVRVLEDMPKDYHNREYYENLLREIANKIVEIQSPKGYWYPSLLDKDEYDTKETSGTAFYCYAIAWGINNNILSIEKFLPTVKKAWNSLTNAVEPDGKLGYVQLVGVGPDRVKREDTELYGTGAFLLAGSEVYKLLNR